MADTNGKTVILEVFRYHPDEGGEGRFQEYEVPFKDEWMVLDALHHVKNHMDGTVTFRWSCCMKVCGSCGMMINGVPKLACSVRMREFGERIRIEPLAGFKVERDLIVDLETFMEKLESVKPYIIRKEGQERSLDDGEYRQSKAELKAFKQYTMCINCMLCYSACPVFGREDHFVGPAAIALAQRYNMDSRDQGKDLRQQVIGGAEGVWECTFVGECSEVCPKNVDPAGAIQRGKLSSSIEWLKSLVLPKGGI